jgi:hypothetical protein
MIATHVITGGLVGTGSGSLPMTGEGTRAAARGSGLLIAVVGWATANRDPKNPAQMMTIAVIFRQRMMHLGFLPLTCPYPSDLEVSRCGTNRI